MSVQQLRQEVQALTRRLENLAVGGQISSKTARNRRRRQRQSARRNGGGAPQVTQSVAPLARGINTPRRRRSGRTAVQPFDGSIRVRRKEFIATLTGSQKSFVSTLSVAAFPWLKKLGAAFDRVIWHSMKIIWKPAVGTTTDGMVCYGVDWASDPKKGPSDYTRQAALNYTPVADHPVWQSNESGLVLPVSKLMTRKEYYVFIDSSRDSPPDNFDLAPGILVAIVDSSLSKTFGEVWIEYDASLFGTQ